MTTVAKAIADSEANGFDTPLQYLYTEPMPHSPQEKKRAITRLRRIQGQADALARVIEDGTDCGTVLQQLAAMRGGINGLMADVLQGHLEESFGVNGEDAQPGQPLDPAKLTQAIDETVSLVRTYLK